MAMLIDILCVFLSTWVNFKSRRKSIPNKSWGIQKGDFLRSEREILYAAICMSFCFQTHYTLL